MLPAWWGWGRRPKHACCTSQNPSSLRTTPASLDWSTLFAHCAPQSRRGHTHRAVLVRDADLLSARRPLHVTHQALVPGVVCVRVCVCVCVFVGGCVCVCACARACMRVCMRAGVHAMPCWLEQLDPTRGSFPQPPLPPSYSAM